jgi:enterochelin esterase-like enzyme
LIAELVNGSVRLTPASDPTPELCREPRLAEEARMREALPYDTRHHQHGTVAAAGRCSWHGRPRCEDTPVISFQDNFGWWQSGCQRALEELVARGEISPPLTVD